MVALTEVRPEAQKEAHVEVQMEVAGGAAGVVARSHPLERAAAELEVQAAAMVER